MGEWKETSLGKISQDIAYGYTASAKQEPVGPKFLRITDIANGPLKWNAVPYCEISDSDRKKYKLNSGDIVIARTGATTGATYTIKPHDPEDVVFASYLIRYRINQSIADPFFIDFCLRSSSWKSYVEGIAGGSAQPGANAQQLATYEILLPPLPEQKAIAEVLSSLDDKIDLLHRQNKTLEALAETLFRRWFVEGVNEDWKDGVLGDIISIGSGKSLSRDFFRENGLYPVLGANGEIGKTDKYLFDEKLIYTGRVGTLGNVFVNQEKAWLSDNTLVIKPASPEHFYFVYFFLKNAELSSYNVGSTQPLIRQSEIKELELQLPPNDHVRGFSTSAENIFKKIDQNKGQIQSLEKLRDTLLPKLMSGEVRVEYG